MSEWQPIETAPKDGSWFVAARFKARHEPIYEVGKYEPCVEYFFEEQHNGLYRKVAREIDGVQSHFNNYHLMTHWSPLPTSPEKSK